MVATIYVAIASFRHGVLQWATFIAIAAWIFAGVYGLAVWGNKRFLDRTADQGLSLLNSDTRPSIAVNYVQIKRNVDKRTMPFNRWAITVCVCVGTIATAVLVVALLAEV